MKDELSSAFDGVSENLPQQERVSAKKISALFEISPERWGLRGDPMLWEELKKRFKDVELPRKREALEKIFQDTYEKVVGRPLSDNDPAYVRDFASIGMSSGHISPQFWREKGFPLLINRYDALSSSVPANTHVVRQGVPKGPFKS